MKKLSKDDEEYQFIEITSKEIIKDFLETFTPFWEEDTLKFENFKDKLKVENIKKLSVWSFIGLQEEIRYNLEFNDNTTKNFYIPNNEFMT